MGRGWLHLALLLVALAGSIGVAQRTRGDSWRSYLKSTRAEPVDAVTLADAATAMWAPYWALLDRDVSAAQQTAAELQRRGHATAAAHFAAKAESLTKRAKPVRLVHDAMMAPLLRLPIAPPVDSKHETSTADGGGETRWPIRNTLLPSCTRGSQGVAYSTAQEVLGHLRREYHLLPVTQEALPNDDSLVRAAHYNRVAKHVANELLSVPTVRNNVEFTVLFPGTGIAGLQHYVVETVAALRATMGVDKPRFRAIGTECSLVFLAASPWLTSVDAVVNLQPFDSRLGLSADHFDASLPLPETELTHLRRPINDLAREAVERGSLRSDVVWNDVFGTAWDDVKGPCADVVVTSYVLDAAVQFGPGKGLPYALDRLANLTCPGGLWINYGPLAYHGLASSADVVDAVGSVSWSLSDIMVYTVEDAFPHSSKPTTPCGSHPGQTWQVDTAPSQLEPVGYSTPYIDDRSTQIHGHRPLFWALRRC